MNIVVAVKPTPDLQQVRFRNRQPVLEDVPLTLGSIDKSALEAGVRLKEALGGKVTVVSVGTEDLEDTIKEALAAGADEAILVENDDPEALPGSMVARLLAAVIQRMERPELIIFGEGSADNYSGQVGSRVAEILGWPQAGYAREIDIRGEVARITRSLEDGEEIVDVILPAVVTVVAEISEPRIPSVTQILKAGRKPREIFTPGELGIEVAVDVVTLSNLAPETRRKGLVLKSADELLQALEAEDVIRR